MRKKEFIAVRKKLTDTRSKRRHAGFEGKKGWIEEGMIGTAGSGVVDVRDSRINSCGTSSRCGNQR